MSETPVRPDPHEVIARLRERACDALTSTAHGRELREAADTIESLLTQISKLTRIVEIEQRNYQRLQICSDHRDKAIGFCVVCQGERRGRLEERERTDEARAQVESLLTAREEQGWRDIASAPKDGSAVLLFPSACWCDEDDRGEVAYWDKFAGAWDRMGPVADDYDGPTHWMPLPSAPLAPLPQQEQQASKEPA